MTGDQKCSGTYGELCISHLMILIKRAYQQWLLIHAACSCPEYSHVVEQ